MRVPSSFVVSGSRANAYLSLSFHRAAVQSEELARRLLFFFMLHVPLFPASWSLFSRYWAGALGRQSAISSGGFRPLCKGGGWGGGRSSRSLGPLLISTNVLGSIAAPSSTMTTFLILLLSPADHSVNDVLLYIPLELIRSSRDSVRKHARLTSSTKLWH